MLLALKVQMEDYQPYNYQYVKQFSKSLLCYSVQKELLFPISYQNASLFASRFKTWTWNITGDSCYEHFITIQLNEEV